MTAKSSKRVFRGKEYWYPQYDNFYNKLHTNEFITIRCPRCGIVEKIVDPFYIGKEPARIYCDRCRRWIEDQRDAML